MTKKHRFISIQSITLTLLLISLFSCTPNKGQLPEGANSLYFESSPYLLQHAYNPVDWFPWGDKALEKAKQEDKLMIISIGYAACHWCHVMEHESFEDSLIARKMNDQYVSIKVDREERPDIDAIYMDAAQLLTGRGGWPLNIVALPDGRPVFTGTYFPRDNWEKVVDYFADLYTKDKNKMLEQADAVTAGIKQIEMPTFSNEALEFSPDKYLSIYDSTKASMDLRLGGRKGAPKFPMPSIYEYLLTYDYFEKDSSAQDLIKTTLDNMAFGGIYDQLGGGFARYSTDKTWTVPHFEKMLYDNSQLVSLYSHAYQKYGDPEYARIIRETLEFVERELGDGSGGFYSSLDADSEGEEGKFYVWEQEEIEEVLGNEAEILKTYYGVTRRGNFEEKNILVKTMSLEELASKFDIPLNEASKIIDSSKEKLFELRSKRIRPGLDDKVLTSWNGLMIIGYVDAYFALGDENYLESAKKCGEFLINNQLRQDFGLWRNYKDGESSINGFLDDYAHSILAFIRLYEATFDEGWLNKALNLKKYVQEHFNDEKTKMFFYTSDEDPKLIARKMELTDNVIPASNSIMANALFLLGQYFYNEEDISRARQMLANVENDVSQSPYFYSNWARLYGLMGNRHFEVAVVGPEAEKKKLKLAQTYIPNKILLGGEDEGTLELLAGKLNVGNTMIYVCENKTCQLPVTQPEDALQQLILN